MLPRARGLTAVLAPPAGDAGRQRSVREPWSDR
jgi:hypothetical protein